MVADDHPERLERRRRPRRQHGGRRWLVPPRPARPRQTGRRRLDRALRVGQLPGDRLPQRRGNRSARGGLDPVRSAAVEAASRCQPACPAGRQPPGPNQHAARAGRRLVELRRGSARGLPAACRRPGHLGAAHPSGVSSRAACTGDAVESRRPPASRDGQRPDPWRHDPARVGAGPGAWKPIGVAADPRPRAVVGSAQAVTVRGRRDGDRRREAGRHLPRAHWIAPAGDPAGRPDDDERAGAEPPRRRRPRADACTWRRAAAGRPCRPDRTAARSRGDADALALPAVGGLPGARRPRRDRGLGGDSLLPAARVGDARPADTPEGPRLPGGCDQARPEPPIGDRVEHRQRVAGDAAARAARLHPRRGRAGAPARPDAAGRAGGGGLPDEELLLGVRATGRAWRQRLLRLVSRAARADRQPGRARPVPRPLPRVLPVEGGFRDGVRRRGQPHRTGRRKGHLRLPDRVHALPPGVIREASLDQRRDRVGAAGLQGAPELDRRQPAARLAMAAQRPVGPERQEEAGVRPHKPDLQADATAGAAMRSTLTTLYVANVDRVLGIAAMRKSFATHIVVNFFRARGRMAAVLAALAIPAAAVPSTAAADPPARITIVAVFDPVTFGDNAYVNGQLLGVGEDGKMVGTGQGGQVVALEQSAPPFTAWTPVGQTTTDPVGYYSFKLHPSQTFQYRTSSQGIGSERVVQVSVAPRIRLKAAAAGRTTISFSGTFAPALDGQSVAIQRRGAHGGWTTVTTAKLRGGTTFRGHFRARNVTAVRAFFASDGAHLSAASNTVKIRR